LVPSGASAAFAGVKLIEVTTGFGAGVGSSALTCAELALEPAASTAVMT
jgi:hypothetical protein